jgi:hypothetical protein
MRSSIDIWQKKPTTPFPIIQSSRNPLMPSYRILVSRNRSSALLTLETHALHPTPRDSRPHINVSTSHDAETKLVFSAFAVMNPMGFDSLSVIYTRCGSQNVNPSLKTGIQCLQ